MRGRPKQTEDIRITKYEQTIYEFDNPEYRDEGYRSVWNFDDKKSPSGAYKVVHHFPKGEKAKKPKIDKGRNYNKKAPVVLVFTAPKLVGVPETAIVVDCGVGNKFIEQYKLKYNL